MYYDVYYKKDSNGRAPEYAFLDEDYNHAGTMTADNPKNLVFKIHQQEAADSELAGQRDIQVGDVISDETNQFLIYTPMNIWARVEAFTDAIEIQPESANSLDT